MASRALPFRLFTNVDTGTTSSVNDGDVNLAVLNSENNLDDTDIGFHELRHQPHL